jgi:hypothetical protein
MEEVKFGLSDLEFSDDLEVSLDNETYQDQALPAPPAAGDYLFRLSTGSVIPALYRGGERKGQPINRTVDGKDYPVLSLRVVEIVEGLGDGVTRKVGLFQDILTNPYERDGVNVSQFGDLARALGLGNYSNLREGLNAVAEVEAAGATFGASLDWESGFDKEFVEAAQEQLGLAGKTRDEMTEGERKIANAIQYRYSKVQGMKNFPYNAETGKFSPSVKRGDVTMKVGTDTYVVKVSPRVLEARAIIPVYFNNIKFIPRERVDSGRVTFGPKTVKPVAVAA